MSQNNPLLICDLDNTLYDWHGYFVPSIYALIKVASKQLQCSEQELAAALRTVHQQHHDSEHPFALLETAIVQEQLGHLPRKRIADVLDPAFHAFNKARKSNLALFPRVLETLIQLRESGITVVAHTESKVFSAVDRIHRLGLEPFLQRIYCREESRSSHPDDDIRARWRIEFDWSKVFRLPTADLKPNPRIIRDIAAREGRALDNILYVGDSLARDIMMANDARVHSVWAKYGATPDPAAFEKLVAISHWSDADVARETQLRQRSHAIQPWFVCNAGFFEVMGAIACFNQLRRYARPG